MKEWLISYSDSAVSNLIGIYHYLAEILQVPETAAAQVLRIRDQVAKLDTLPERYPLHDTDRGREISLHRMNIDNYAVFYTLHESENTVFVVHILYAGSDIDAVI